MRVRSNDALRPCSARSSRGIAQPCEAGSLRFFGQGRRPVKSRADGQAAGPVAGAKQCRDARAEKGSVSL